MAELYEQFQERARRMVGRFMLHAKAEGLHPGVLDGDITLTIEDGVLAKIEFPPNKRTGKSFVAEIVAAEPEPEPEAAIDTQEAAPLYIPPEEPTDNP